MCVTLTRVDSDEPMWMTLTVWVTMTVWVTLTAVDNVDYRTSSHRTRANWDRVGLRRPHARCSPTREKPSGTGEPLAWAVRGSGRCEWASGVTHVPVTRACSP